MKVSQYQDKENIYTGEVGRLFGVRLVETTEAKIFEGAGADGADVASVIVLAVRLRRDEPSRAQSRA